MVIACNVCMHVLPRYTVSLSLGNKDGPRSASAPSSFIRKSLTAVIRGI